LEMLPRTSKTIGAATLRRPSGALLCDTSGVELMNVRPLHDRIVVRRFEDGEQNVGGIIIPDTAKEKPQRGTVIAAGSGVVNDSGARVPLDVKTGDVIVFGKYTSQEITLDGEAFLIMREDEVLAVIETN
jgi:chaperonin GroES